MKIKRLKEYAYLIAHKGINVQKGRKYIINELNISLNDDVLPMCSTVAYLRPFLLNKEKAMKL